MIEFLLAAAIGAAVTATAIVVAASIAEWRRPKPRYRVEVVRYRRTVDQMVSGADVVGYDETILTLGGNLSLDIAVSLAAQDTSPRRSIIDEATGDTFAEFVLGEVGR